MILKGSQRGNARELSKHLMNMRDNEHVELHDLRGFMSEDDLHEALAEAEAISKGTRCKQHLFSLSLQLYLTLCSLCLMLRIAFRQQPYHLGVLFVVMCALLIHLRL